MTAMANHLLSWLLCPALAVKTPIWDLPFLVFFSVTSFDVTVNMCNNLETLVPGSSCMTACPIGAYKDGLSMSFRLRGRWGVCCQSHRGTTLGLHSPFGSSAPRAMDIILSVTAQPLSRKGTGIGEECSHHAMLPVLGTGSPC